MTASFLSTWLAFRSRHSSTLAIVLACISFYEWLGSVLFASLLETFDNYRSVYMWTGWPNDVITCSDATTYDSTFTVDENDDLESITFDEEIMYCLAGDTTPHVSYTLYLDDFSGTGYPGREVAGSCDDLEALDSGKDPSEFYWGSSEIKNRLVCFYEACSVCERSVSTCYAYSASIRSEYSWDYYYHLQQDLVEYGYEFEFINRFGNYCYERERNQQIAKLSQVCLILLVVCESVKVFLCLLWFFSVKFQQTGLINIGINSLFVWIISLFSQRFKDSLMIIVNDDERHSSRAFGMAFDMGMNQIPMLFLTINWVQYVEKRQNNEFGVWLLIVVCLSGTILALCVNLCIFIFNLKQSFRDAQEANDAPAQAADIKNKGPRSDVESEMANNLSQNGAGELVSNDSVETRLMQMEARMESRMDAIENIIKKYIPQANDDFLLARERIVDATGGIRSRTHGQSSIASFSMDQNDVVGLEMDLESAKNDEQQGQRNVETGSPPVNGGTATVGNANAEGHTYQ